MSAKKTPQKPKRIPVRSETQVTLTISLSKDLKAAIEAAAKLDNRTMSNYLATEIAKMLKPSD